MHLGYTEDKWRAFLFIVFTSTIQVTEVAETFLYLALKVVQCIDLTHLET